MSNEEEERLYFEAYDVLRHLYNIDLDFNDFIEYLDEVFKHADSTCEQR